VNDSNHITSHEVKKVCRGEGPSRTQTSTHTVAFSKKGEFKWLWLLERREGT